MFNVQHLSVLQKRVALLHEKVLSSYELTAMLLFRDQSLHTSRLLDPALVPICECIFASGAHQVHCMSPMPCSDACWSPQLGQYATGVAGL